MSTITVDTVPRPQRQIFACIYLVMSNATSLEFNEVWSWDGWTTLDESINDGAVDTDGNLVLVGSQGREEVELDDDTFVDELDGDFATVKLSGDGRVMWTWTDSSSGSQADYMLSVDTDGNDDVRSLKFVCGSATERWLCSCPPRPCAIVYRHG